MASKRSSRILAAAAKGTQSVRTGRVTKKAQTPPIIIPDKKKSTIVPIKFKETKATTERKPKKAATPIKDEPKNEQDDPSIEIEEPKKGKKEPKRHPCAICLKDFKGRNDLRKHLRTHTDERPFQCTHCSKKFRQGGCLKNHFASQHFTEIHFSCDYCSKKFPVKERLRLHMRVHTGEKPYSCHICVKKFARGGQLTQHMVSHTGIKRHKCDYCGSKFSCLANVKIHMKSHMAIREFVCHMCSKAFYRRDALKKHISCLHENKKAFHCKICNKSFKGHLPQHMRTHNKIKTHGCNACGSLFSQRSQLIVHQRIHSGVRPYRCQVCMQAFAHSSVLKLHIRKHTGEKPFKCPICVKSGIAFSQLPHLKKHMLSIHGKSNPYMCAQCENFFKTKQELTHHMQHDCKKGKKSIVEVVNSQSNVDTPMAIEKMRLLVTILLKKISTDARLKELGYEKRLIDNVLVDSLRCAGRKSHSSTELPEADRLKKNIHEFLLWTIPSVSMTQFKRDGNSTEEILEKLVGTF